MTRGPGPDLAAAREQALTVACTYPRCGAAIDEPCKNPITGTPLRVPHACRLDAAGVKFEPVRRNEVSGWPKRRDRDAQLAAGRAEYDRAVQAAARNRAHQLQRRHELECDRRAGALTETTRAELVDLDRLLNDDPTEPATTPDDTPEGDVTWLRGPRGTR